jgi:uncharacterized membrane protein YkoI
MRQSRILLMLLTVAAALSTATCRGGEDAADESDTQGVLLHAGAAGAPLVAVPEDDEDDDDEDEDEFEEDVALDDLPQLVRDAVLAAVPGLQLTSAEIEIEAGKTAYCVHGTLDGESMEVEVAPDGTVLEIERDD